MWRQTHSRMVVVLRWLEAVNEVVGGGPEGESDLRGAEVSSGARRRLSVRLDGGGGCPRPYQRVGAPFGRKFEKTSRRFFPPKAGAPVRRRAQSEGRGAAPRGLPGGRGACVGARRENGAKMQCWAPRLCRLLFGFRDGRCIGRNPTRVFHVR